MTTDTHAPFREEHSAVFDGLNKTEEVVIFASIVVGSLAVSAVILRLMMPLVRRKYLQSKGKQPTMTANKSSSHLIGSATPTSSSSSRASTISRSSQSDNEKGKDEATDISTVSGKTGSYPTRSVYCNLRSDGLALPLYLPHTQSEKQKSSSSLQLLNNELTAVISTPSFQRLQSLNLTDTYRDNWDRTFDASNMHGRSLSHVTHPSESRKIPDLPDVHRPVTKNYQRQPESRAEQQTKF